jgi:RimJ/RimL family protein N-acetyltransferase
MMMGIGLFFEYVFGCWDVRKLYMEVAEYNFPQMESGIGRFFELEGRLRNHTYLAGKHWDQLTLALYRDAWTSERVQRLVQAATYG